MGHVEARQREDCRVHSEAGNCGSVLPHGRWNEARTDTRGTAAVVVAAAVGGVEKQIEESRCATEPVAAPAAVGTTAAVAAAVGVAVAVAAVPAEPELELDVGLGAGLGAELVVEAVAEFAALATDKP